LNAGAANPTVAWRHVAASRFQDYEEAWRTLNARTGNSPVLDPEFVMPLLDHFADGCTRLAIAGGDASPVALAIVRPSRPGSWQTLQPSQAPIALWVAEPGYSPSELLPALLRSLPGLPLACGISQLDPDIVPHPGNTEHMETVNYVQTGRIAIDSSFEEYWAARGKNLRHNLKRQMNKMKGEGITGQFQVLTLPAEMNRAIDEYGQLESKGWKSEGGTAIASSNTQGRFYRAMLERFAARGAARVYSYRIGSRLAAVDLCIAQGQTLVILKTTYDESIAGYSPALLMHDAMFRQIFEEKQIRRIEFYGKTMEWHTKWTKEFRCLYHLNHFRWPFLLQLRRWRRPVNAALAVQS
jgi:CelD/BcsL family acetyltransferase involved in cellulose biosynthesis